MHNHRSESADTRCPPKSSQKATKEALRGRAPPPKQPKTSQKTAGEASTRDARPHPRSNHRRENAATRQPRANALPKTQPTRGPSWPCGRCLSNTARCWSSFGASYAQCGPSVQIRGTSGLPSLFKIWPTWIQIRAKLCRTWAKAISSWQASHKTGPRFSEVGQISAAIKRIWPNLARLAEFGPIWTNSGELWSTFRPMLAAIWPKFAPMRSNLANMG